MGETFAKFGLNPGEFDVLTTLRRSGATYLLSPTRLYHALMVSSGTITHRIDPPKLAELVKRMPDPIDRRGTWIPCTEKGADLIEKTVETYVTREHQLLSVLE